MTEVESVRLVSLVEPETTSSSANRSRSATPHVANLVHPEPNKPQTVEKPQALGQDEDENKLQDESPNEDTPARERSRSFDENGLEKRKFKCPQCHQGFTRMHNLKSHVLTHTHEKPFTCDRCSSKFRRINDLKRHLKLHTGERPYVCKLCSRRFARGDALIRHIKNSKPCSEQPESTTASSTAISRSTPLVSISPGSSTTTLPVTEPVRPITPMRLSHLDMPQHYRPNLIGPTFMPERVLPPPLQQQPSNTWRLPPPNTVQSSFRSSTPTTQSESSSTPISAVNSSTPNKNEDLINMNRMLEIRVRALEERLAIAEERLVSLEHR